MVPAKPSRTRQPLRRPANGGNVSELVEQARVPSPEAVARFTNLMRARKMTPLPAADEPWHAIRGGAFTDKDLNPTMVWDFATVPAGWRNFDIGFRCARDAPR